MIYVAIHHQKPLSNEHHSSKQIYYCNNNSALFVPRRFPQCSMVLLLT